MTTAELGTYKFAFGILETLITNTPHTTEKTENHIKALKTAWLAMRDQKAKMRSIAIIGYPISRPGAFLFRDKYTIGALRDAHAACLHVIERETRAADE